jgi:hypothetical protein
MTRWLLPVLVSALGCCEEPAPATATLYVTYPEATAGIVPYGPGGTFKMTVTATLDGVSRSGTGTVESVDVSDPKPPGPVTFSLTNTVPGVGSGTVVLSHLRGGDAPFRIHAFGVSQDVTVPLEVPGFDANLAVKGFTGTSTAADLCLETSATGGTLEVKLDNAKFGDGTSDTQIPIGDGTCGLLPNRHTHRRGQARIQTNGGDVVVRATLVGTELGLAPMTFPVDVQGLSLSVAANPTTLPAPGAPVEVTVTALVAGNPTPRIPITLEIIPDVQLLPKSLLTGQDGTARATFLAPDTSAVRVDAIVGNVRTGTTVQR